MNSLPDMTLRDLLGPGMKGIVEIWGDDPERMMEACEDNDTSVEELGGMPIGAVVYEEHDSRHMLNEVWLLVQTPEGEILLPDRT